jgi:hypothetical protein
MQVEPQTCTIVEKIGLIPHYLLRGIRLFSFKVLKMENSAPSGKYVGKEHSLMAWSLTA